jgi:predicted transcriptional regulator YheO
MNKTQKSATIKMLARMGEALCRTIGPQCEVAIHNLADMEHSIVWIMGTVTGRKVGGCMTSRGLSLVRSGNTQDNYNYTTRTRDGKTVRSSLLFVKDKRERPVIGIEINFDTSPFVAFRHTLETLTDPDEAYDFQDAFIDDAPQMLETMLHKAIGFIGKPVPQMSKADRLRVVQILDEAGALELRKAIPAVASYLGVTRFTIHNYLNEIREQTAPDTTDGNADH